jgi:hypothetical protein
MLPLCRFHHRLKTFAGWLVRFTTPDQPYPPGTVEWTSPHGQHLIDLPPNLPGSNTWTPPTRSDRPSQPNPSDRPDRPDRPRTDTHGDDQCSGTDGGDETDGPDADIDQTYDPRDATTTERRALRTQLWNSELRRINKTQDPQAPDTPPAPPSSPLQPEDNGEPPF